MSGGFIRTSVGWFKSCFSADSKAIETHDSFEHRPRASAPLRRGHTRRSPFEASIALDRILTVAWNRSAAETPSGAWCGSHVAAQRSWMRPHSRRSSRSRGSECELVVRRMGSRRRPRRGLHSRIASLWAFPSPTQRRSPIACGSPPARLCGRTSGGGAADHFTHAPCVSDLSLSQFRIVFSCMEIVTNRSGGSRQERPNFFKSRRAKARSPLCFNNKLCR